MSEPALARRIGPDPSDMTARVLGLPRQLREAWALAAGGPDLLAGARPSCIHVVGMGGSAIGGDFLRSLADVQGSVPVEVVRGYELPQAAGPGSFAFFVSYSGGTEETLAAWEDARRRRVPSAAITSGGTLESLAREAGRPVLRIPGGSPPRAALAWTSIPLFHALGRAGLLAIGAEDVEAAAAAGERILAASGPGGPREPALAEWAKQAAAGLPIVYAAERPHRATALRWVGQLHENGKTLSHAAVFPEQNHNEIVAWEVGGPGVSIGCIALLDDPAVHPRVRRRLDLVAARVEEAGRPLVRFRPEGEGLLARVYSLVLLGDLASLHVAAARGVDPTPVASIDRLKRELA
ncbi:MAG: bifunctional phosphoglucose/phosphomannose isomerase [bacterium]